MGKKKLGFIGTGKMASALVSFILNSKKVSSSNIICSDIKQENIKNIKKTHSILIGSNREVCRFADIIFLCVKPQDMAGLLEEIKNETDGKLIISIAAGITLSLLEQHLGRARIVRVMPNTPCIVGEMAAVYSLGKNATSGDKMLLNEMLGSTGILLEMEESLIAPAAIISGCGPAFYAYFISAFVKAASKYNVPEEVAVKLAEQTCIGTGRLLLETKMLPDELIKMVASPKGVTEAGLKVLDRNNLNRIIQETVDAAMKRTAELSGGK